MTFRFAFRSFFLAITGVVLYFAGMQGGIQFERSRIESRAKTLSQFYEKNKDKLTSVEARADPGNDSAEESIFRHSILLHKAMMYAENVLKSPSKR